MGKASKLDLFKKPFIHVILIVILGLLVYSNTFNVPFHFDDSPNIVENYKLRDLNNLWPPKGTRWFGFFTFALNYKLGGLNVIGYHIVNLIIHIFNAILIYFLVLLTFRTPFFRSQESEGTPLYPPLLRGELKGGIALSSALIFVSHPIQTQSVTYIVQRFTSLATLLYILSLVMFIKWRHQTLEIQNVIARGQSPRRNLIESGKENSRGILPRMLGKMPNLFLIYAKRYTLYVISLISAILAMKTKEISFTLPFIIVLYELFFFGRTLNLKRFLFLLPFLLTLPIIPLSLIGIDKPIGDTIGELREAFQETEAISRDVYLLTQFRVIVTYIRLLFLPINQNLDYDYPVYPSFLNPEVFLSFLFLLSIFSFAVYLFLRSRKTNNGYGLLASFGILWFFITLSVESSVIPIRDVIFEHRLYLPSVGAVAAFSLMISWSLNYAKAKNHVLFAICILFLSIIVPFSIAAYTRNTVWKDGVSLWEDVVKKFPNKARGHNNLGAAYADIMQLDAALQEYKDALRLKPGYARAYLGLGLAYYEQGRLDEALQEYKAALRLEPDYAEAHNNLGNVYYAKGWIDKAIEHYQIALSLKPDYAEAHNNLGLVYQSKGLSDMAIEQYQIALSLRPDLAEAHNNLGLVYQSKGLYDMAIEQYQIALSLRPDLAEAHNNLGNVYYAKGWIDKAIEHYQIALSLKPDYAEAHNHLGSAYGIKGWVDKAIKHFQIALRLKPEYADAYNNLGVVYEKKGLLDEAIREYQAALRLNPNDEVARNNLNRILRMKK